MLCILFIEGDQVFSDVVQVLVLHDCVHFLLLQNYGVTGELGTWLSLQSLLMRMRYNVDPVGIHEVMVVVIYETILQDLQPEIVFWF